MAGDQVAARGRGVEAGDMDGQDQVEMGEGVAHLADILPVGFGGGLAALSVPSVARNTQHPAEQALVGAAFQQDRSVAVAKPERAMPGGFFRLRRLARQVGLHPCPAGKAGVRPGADAAGRGAWGADRGAEVHDGLGIVSRTVLRGQAGGEAGEFGLGGGKRGFDAVETGDDTLDIAVDHGGGLVEGDGRDGAGGIGADAGQGQEGFAGGWELPAMVRDDGAGAFQKVAGTGVVAKTGPFAHHLGVLGGGQGADGRPAGGEAVEVVLHRGDGGLLQHHLGQPDAVGIGADTRSPVLRRDAPGHHAGMGVIPGEKLGGEGFGVLHRGEDSGCGAGDQWRLLRGRITLA